MSPVLRLLQEIERRRGELWSENGLVRYRFEPGMLTPDLLEEMKQNKSEILRYLALEKHLKNQGWMTLSRWDTYEKRLTSQHGLYLFCELDGWCLWSATWIPGKAAPIKQKDLAEKLSFEEAVYRANKYLTWWTTRRSA